MNQQIIDALNGLIATELVAVNQYFMHAKLCEHWGFEKMAAHLREDSIDEMRDSMSLTRCSSPQAFERGSYLRVLHSWQHSP